MVEKYDTLKFYNDNAEQYCEKTLNLDMHEHYARFIAFLPDRAYVLDFGCGSGRDSKFFLEKGYTVTAIDGSEQMCKIASEYIGQEVKCMKFDELSEEDTYDGIWACSSILHVEKENLPDILRKMLKAIKEDGIIYTSFKAGDTYDIKDGKYFNDINKETLAAMLGNLEPPGEIVEYYETVPVNSSHNVNWGNYFIKRKK